jgi:hypothetical protein
MQLEPLIKRWDGNELGHEMERGQKVHRGNIVGSKLLEGGEERGGGARRLLTSAKNQKKSTNQTSHPVSYDSTT